jgi:CRISPR/Cas system-associated exonuclease Cas4 (RecB family)
MGILETRALDFDNLIVIGLNEGTFPKTSPPNSFIPFNLRKGHGLPTIDNQDSIFAYYFYRLINRAKKIKLVYTTTKSLTEEGEMSRFLQQLYYEYPQKITMQTMLQQVTIPAKPKIWASKDSEVMQIMNQWLSDGGKDLSPSALSQYLDCPLKFYYRYVAKISEPDEISEDLDPRVFGNLFHQIVEMLYKPFEGKVINHSDLDAISKNRQLIRQTMDDVFVQNIPFIKHKTNLFNDLQGKNSLVYEIIYNYILQFLECEKKTTPFKLIALEERVSCKLKLKNGLTVNIGGTIDRTDEKDGVIRIIDYKTGKATTEITNIEKLFTQDDHSENKAIFQTLLYSLVKAHSTKNKEIAPGVISVKKLYANDYDIQLYLKEGKEKTPITLSLVEENYREHLEHSLAQLLTQKYLLHKPKMLIVVTIAYTKPIV